MDEDESLARPDSTTSFHPQATNFRAQLQPSILKQTSLRPTAFAAAAAAADSDEDSEDLEFKNAVNYLEGEQDRVSNFGNYKTMPGVSELKSPGLKDWKNDQSNRKVDFKIFEGYENESDSEEDDLEDSEESFDSSDRKKQDTSSMTKDTIKYLFDMAVWLDSGDGRLKTTVKIELASGMIDEDCVCKLEDNGRTLIFEERFPDILLLGSEVVERHSNIPANFAKAMATKKLLMQRGNPLINVRQKNYLTAKPSFYHLPMNLPHILCMMKMEMKRKKKFYLKSTCIGTQSVKRERRSKQ